MEDFDIITFDCYGTLIDWERGIVGAFQSEASRQGLTLNSDEIINAYHSQEPVVESMEYLQYREVLSKTAEQIAGRLGLEIRPERRYFLAESLPGWKPFPDTNPALERLARKYK